jgi:hypothetical protein
MAASPLPQNTLVVLFGHDPVVIPERCSALRNGGYDCLVTMTASETEVYLSNRHADALLIGSQTGPLTRLRLAAKARQHGVAVVHIAYPNHPEPAEDEIYVTRPLGETELLSAMTKALRRRR